MRHRYIQHPDTLELIEVAEDYIPESRANSNPLAGDRHYDGLRATDGTDISTRSKHREYMRVNNLTTMDDFKGEWNKARVERNDHYTTGGDHKARREALNRAIYELENGRRRRNS